LDAPAHFRVFKSNWTKSDVKYVILFLNDGLVFVKTGTDLDEEGIIWYHSEAGRLDLSPLGGYSGYSGPFEQKTADKAVSALRNTPGRAMLRKYDEQLKEFIAAISKLSVPEMLALDDDNFEIRHAEIRSVKITKAGMLSGSRVRKGRLVVEWKRKDQFDIMLTEDFAKCKNIVERYFQTMVK
jgi:hypothetical protein